MNDKQRIYCDGAAFAYKDVADAIRRMIAGSPYHLREYLEAMEPIAVSCENKAVAVYEECEDFTNGARH